MRSVVALALTALVGCHIQNESELQQQRLLKAQEHNRQLAKESEAQHQREREEAQARTEAYFQRSRELQEAAKKARADAHAEDCATDLPQREAAMQKHIDDKERVRGLVQWELDHCRWEDHAKEVTKVRQDSHGEYHTVQRPDRGVDRICDAPKPAELETTYARSLGIWNPSGKVLGRLMTCGDVDRASSSVGKKYYGVE